MTPIPNLTNSEIISAVKTILDQPHSTASLKSKKKYEETVKRLVRLNTTPIDHAMTLGAFCHYRSAWVYFHRMRVRALNAELNALASNSDIEKKWLIGHEIIHHVRALLGYDTALDSTKKNSREPGLWALKQEEMKLAGDRPVSHSKRHLNAKLPIGWQDQILNHVINVKCVHALAIAVMSASGCRPAEFEEGIIVKVLSGDEIKITIRGVKTHGGKYGQAERSFALPVSSLATRTLFNEAKNKTRGVMAVTAKSQSLSMAVTRVSQLLWPAPKAPRPSAYSFRHAFSSDLKTDKTNRSVIAQALGHCTDQTLVCYAGATRTGGGLGIKNVESSTQPREIVANKIANLSPACETDSRGM